MNRLKGFLRNMRTSFLFMPSAIVAFSVIIAGILISVDSAGIMQWTKNWPRLFGAGGAAARGMLSMIAGSMMTVVGITFSMTLMTLMLASGQYTSRILRNFIRDKVTQVVLGIFSGNFTYCLIVLRTIRDGEDGFIPSLSVFLAVVLAICSIGALIFFIHHIAITIQASSIIASVAEETVEAVYRLFPENLAREMEADDEDLLPRQMPVRNWLPIPVERSGYIQSVDNAAILRLACGHNTIVRMERGVGDFVVSGTALASLALERPPGREIAAALRAAYNISRHRTLQQDCAFGIRQIVDMALRALSPGINDVTTAVMCVDYLTVILARLAVSNFPSLHRYMEGELRVIAIGRTFAGLVSESFDQIRRSAEGNVAVMLRMLGAILTVSGLTEKPDRRQALGEQMRLIAELTERTVKSPYDRALLENRMELLRQSGIC
ncbi:MAG: DUF2254 domain-containing protein [Spirochaetes bacterium]|nr:DUF2254 domain-containing protein [Spirochaetota bacterium]